MKKINDTINETLKKNDTVIDKTSYDTITEKK